MTHAALMTDVIWPEHPDSWDCPPAWAPAHIASLALDDLIAGLGERLCLGYWTPSSRLVLMAIFERLNAPHAPHHHRLTACGRLSTWVRSWAAGHTQEPIGLVIEHTSGWSQTNRSAIWDVFRSPLAMAIEFRCAEIVTVVARQSSPSTLTACAANLVTNPSSPSSDVVRALAPHTLPNLQDVLERGVRGQIWWWAWDMFVQANATGPIAWEQLATQCQGHPKITLLEEAWARHPHPHPPSLIQVMDLLWAKSSGLCPHHTAQQLKTALAAETGAPDDGTPRRM